MPTPSLVFRRIQTGLAIVALLTHRRQLCLHSVRCSVPLGMHSNGLCHRCAISSPGVKDAYIPKVPLGMRSNGLCKHCIRSSPESKMSTFRCIRSSPESKMPTLRYVFRPTVLVMRSNGLEQSLHCQLFH